MRGDELLAFLAVVVVIAIGVAVGVWLRSRNVHRRSALRQEFGPEYDRLVAQYGDRNRAERELSAREDRVRKLKIRLLSPQERDGFGAAWAGIQHRFVDDPGGAVTAADQLVKQVMVTRGYPMENFAQRVADLSVDHANVVQHYRAARALAASSAAGNASTEDLRQAMVHYRALFSDLLQSYNPYEAAQLHEART
jgi:hypothetical protein